MRCPVCDSDNLDDSAECVSCGKAFPSRAEDGRAAAALEELEMTQVAPPEAPVRVEPLAGLEHTRLPADRAAQSQWTAEAMPLERTQHEVDAEAQGAWEGYGGGEAGGVCRGGGARRRGGGAAPPGARRPLPPRRRRGLLLGAARGRVRQAARGFPDPAALLLAAGAARPAPALGCRAQL